jgi:membrane protease YdiL (CAAX protease family)
VSFRLLILGELVLLVVGLLWKFLGSLPVPIELSLDGLRWGLWLTLGLALINFSLYSLARHVRYGRNVRSFLEENIFPMVREATPWELLAAAALAGAAEELLFRGLLQPRIGLVAASALFGYLHGPSRGLVSLALWAGGVGAILGLIFRATGNLFVPALVHGLYDALALFYIRYRPEPSA